MKPVRMKTPYEYLQKVSFVSPGMLLLLLLTGYPLISVVQMSFYSYKKYNEPVFAGLFNYVETIRDPLFWNAMLNTILFSVASVTIIIVSGLFFASLLSQHINTKLRGALRTSLMLPWLFSSSVVASLWVIMLNPFGIVNWLLMKLGIVSEVIGWLGDERFALMALVITNVWRSFPFAMLMLLAGLQTVSEDIKEAAVVDGAGPIKTFFYVILPQVKNVVFTVTTLQLIWDFRSFDLVFIMTGGGPMNKTEVPSTLVYTQAFRSMDFGRSAAVAIFMLLILIVMSFAYLRSTLGKE